MPKVNFTKKVKNPIFKNIDWIGIIHEFEGTESITEVKLTGFHSTSPDNHFYELKTNEGTLYIYEVDYISSLESEIADIKSVLGPDIQLFKVKETLEFKSSGPVLASTVHAKPDDWEEIKKYVTDYSGTAEYYFKFLIRIK